MAMTNRDQGKLLVAGFRLFRLPEEGMTIKEAKSPGAWGVHSRYGTKAACKRAWNDLMKKETNIEG